MNGLKGRMLRMPPKGDKKREFLIVYGHHTSLERMYGVAEVLNEYGGVTMPDLPGFGGMDSFFTIKEKPTLDALADYLASFIKMRYRKSHVTLIGLSLGFLVITRMLHRYPELGKKVDLVVSLAGFAHRDDFTFSPTRHRLYLTGAQVFKHRLPAIFFRNIFLHPFVLRKVYHRMHNAKEKFKDLDNETHKVMTEFEVQLWRINEVRTYMTTGKEFLTVDNTKKKISVPACHVMVPGDKYFDNKSVVANMRKIFDNLKVYTAKTDSHSPSIIGEKKFAGVIFPPALRRRLSRPS
jgi:pimeloyl-ACP methyl ester carboxylesterase